MAVKREDSNFLFDAHGHPEKLCQQKLTGARRTAGGENFPARYIILKRKIYEVKKNGSKNQIKKNGSEESS
ncbi:MAG: hypothetical protein K2P40_02405, partial [Lachnospiraceae bacterium]|nr:hypothetical protein [Lachnospiraceae bacterium]